MEMNKVLVFNIRGKAAHFKKFYSNKSSLTYSLPTRTVLMGMVSSILGYSRDSYYDLFAPDKAKFGVKIIKDGVPHFECMNYLKKDGGRTQVRLQLLLPKEDMIEYQVFCVHRDKEILEKLEHKIKNEKLGYGLFLGQRQFRATAEFIKVINSPTKLKDYQGKISTLNFKDNIKELDVNNEVRLTTINMPISFKKVKSGREPEQVTKVCFEEQGKPLNGSFVEAVQLEEECISFFTPIKGD